MFVGIDVGQARIHVVGLDGSLCVRGAWIVDARAIEDLDPLLSDATVIAVDAPDRLSTAPHGDDPALARKFRSARCAEIALGRTRRVWVPWVTPTAAQPCPLWMQVGFEVFSRPRARGARVVEVYPYAGFRALKGAPLPSKRTGPGLATRTKLLRSAGLRIDGLETRSHDWVDAALAALVAYQVDRGSAEAVSCGHDGSAIWLPKASRRNPFGVPN